jgi:hypothetical protein
MIFSYNHAMSQFKTKKLNHTPVKKIQDTTATITMSTNPKKKIRKIIAITLVILALVFGINYAVQGIGNIRIGTAGDDSTWIPPVFEATGITTPVRK